MRSIKIMAAALALAAPANAFAADIATIGCVSDGTPAPIAAAIGASAATIIKPVRDEGPPEAAMEVLREASARCKARHDWTDAETDAAIGYTLAVYGAKALEEVMRGQGLDPLKVRAAFDSMPAEQRVLIFQDDAAIDAFIERLDQQGIHVSTNLDHAELAGALAAMWAIQDMMRERFIA